MATTLGNVDPSIATSKGVVGWSRSRLVADILHKPIDRSAYSSQARSRIPAESLITECELSGRPERKLHDLPEFVGVRVGTRIDDPKPFRQRSRAVIKSAKNNVDERQGDCVVLRFVKVSAMVEAMQFRPDEQKVKPSGTHIYLAMRDQRLNSNNGREQQYRFRSCPEIVHRQQRHQPSNDENVNRMKCWMHQDVYLFRQMMRGVAPPQKSPKPTVQ